MSTTQLSLMLLCLWSTIIAIAIARTPHQCYYDVDKPAADDILPCYPSTFSAHYTCCIAGDKCLEDKACYDLDTGNTYQYGCTDSSFTDAHCPQKCDLDTAKSHWIGLVYCNGTQNLPNNTWLCHHPDNCGNIGNCADKIWSDELEKMPPTGCEDLKHGDDYVAFTAAVTLSDTAVLPVPSKTSAWWAANAGRYQTTSSSLLPTTQVITASVPPSVLANSVVSSTSSTASSLTSTTSITALDPRPTAASPSPAEKQNHIGIGIGVGVGVPLTLCIAALGLIFTRRRRKRRGDPTSTLIHDTSTPDEKSTAAAYGHKSELDGTPITETYGSPGLSEMQGSSVEGTPWQSPVMVQGEVRGKRRMSGDEREVCELAG